MQEFVCSGNIAYMKQKLFTPEELKDRLSYDPETGKLFWKKCRNKKRIGEEAKSLDVCGYIQVNMQYVVMKGHRIAWAIFYGAWPEDHIDHINGIRNDNRIVNLRCVSGTINTQNKRIGSCKNATGFLGVSLAKHCSPAYRYRAKIQIGKKQIHLGGFATPEEAHTAYVVAKRQLHEGCTI